MNRRGQQVSERIVVFEQAGLRDDPRLEDWFAEGEKFKAELRAAVHKEIDPASVAEAPVRDWQAYSRDVMRELGLDGSLTDAETDPASEKGMSLTELIESRARRGLLPPDLLENLPLAGATINMDELEPMMHGWIAEHPSASELEVAVETNRAIVELHDRGVEDENEEGRFLIFIIDANGYVLSAQGEYLLPAELRQT